VIYQDVVPTRAARLMGGVTETTMWAAEAVML